MTEILGKVPYVWMCIQLKIAKITSAINGSVLNRTHRAVCYLFTVPLVLSAGYAVTSCGRIISQK
jgi:hypothetical protein